MHVTSGSVENMDMGVADLHIHTGVGDGLASVSQILDYVEHHTALDVIAITDHDDIEGGHQARELIAKGGYRFEVVVGEEVTTLEGHLLALYIERPVPSLRSLRKTLDAIHEQGGIAVVPHPMSWVTRSVGRRSLESILSNAADGSGIDALETVNPIAGRVSYKKVKLLNETRYRLAETGGSDAHFLALIGQGYTLFPGRKAADLRRAIVGKTTLAGGGFSSIWGKIGYQDILSQQFRSLVVLPCRHARRFMHHILGRVVPS